MKEHVGVIGFAVIVLAVGCGGNSGGSSSSTGFNPGVQGSKTLNQLSPADVQILCKNEEAYFTSPSTLFVTQDVTCRLAGLFVALLGSDATSTDAEIQMMCQQGYSACVSDDGGVTTADDGGVTTTDVDAGAGSDCAGAMSAPADCTATVDQYTACLNEEIAELQNSAPACNELTQAKLAMFASAADGGASMPMAGPACTAFQAACPGIAINETSSALRAMSRTRAAR